MAIEQVSEATPRHCGRILAGPLFSEPVRVETGRANGAGSPVAGLAGTQTERFRSVGLAADDIAGLTIIGSNLPSDADGRPPSFQRVRLEGRTMGWAQLE